MWFRKIEEGQKSRAEEMKYSLDGNALVAIQQFYAQLCLL